MHGCLHHDRVHKIGSHAIGLHGYQPQDAAVVGVDFKWPPLDFGSSENPAIRLTGVPEGTRRFFVGPVDLDVSTYGR